MRPSPSLSLAISPLAVSVAGRVGHAFAPPAMLKGFECHARGVELLDAARGHVRARVRGPRPQEVDLKVDGARLHIRCTCPAESMTPDPCRHAWAALLEIDRRGLLDDLRDRRGPVKVDTERESAEPAKPEPATPKPTKRRPTRPEPPKRTPKAAGPARAAKKRSKGR